MVNNRCRTYIQVNIYGQTLQQLEKKGIALQSVLNEIGCTHHWIGETPFCTEVINKQDNPLLSTTIAEVKLPRCSTRVVPHSEPQTNFTFNMQQKISEIDEDDEMIDVDVEEVLSDVLDEVVALTQADNKAVLPLFSTTIAVSEFPRYSTPIPFEDDVGSHFTLNFSGDVSNIVSDADEELFSGYSVQSQEFVKSNSSILNVTSNSNSKKSEESEDRTLSGAKERTTRAPEQSSVTPVKICKRNVGEYDALVEPKYERAAFRKNSTNVFCPNFNDSLYQSGPLIVKLQNSDRDENGDETNNFGNSDFPNGKNTTEDCEEVFYSIPRNEGTEIVGCDDILTESSTEIPRVALKLEHNISGFLDNRNDEMLPQSDEMQNQKVYHELKPVGQLLSYPSAHLYINSSDNEVKEDGPYHSIQEGRGEEDNDETLQMISNLSKRQYFPPLWPDRISTKSILKTVGSVDTRDKKAVSFKVPNPKGEKRRNSAQSYTIVCGYEACGRQMHWKLQYGKLRLLSHALTHQKKKRMTCRNCDFTCQTVGQIRYHYKKTHSNVKMTGFGIMNIPYEDIDINDVWQKCFGKQVHIVGDISPKRFSRRKDVDKKIKENKNNENDDVHPTSSNNQ